MVIYGDIEKQIYHIQKLLVNKLDKCKEKENVLVKKHIWEIQEASKIQLKIHPTNKCR